MESVSDTKGRVYKLSDQHQKDSLEFFRKLIKIQSENYGNGKGNEKNIANFVSDALSPLGLKGKFYEPAENRLSYVAQLEGSTKSKSSNLALYSHLDTVPVGNLDDWTHPPFAAVISDGRLHGRGTADNKQGIASNISAIKYLVESGVELKGNVTLLLVADEENGGNLGLASVLKNGDVKPSYCCYTHNGIPEDELAPFFLGLGHRGLIWVKVSIKGKAAHSSRKEEGLNAIYLMSKFVQRIEELKVPVNPHHIVPGGITISVNMINGGKKNNVVADTCDAIIDCRHIPGFTSADLVRIVNYNLDRVRVETGNFTSEVTVLSEAESTFVEQTEPIVSEVESVYREFNPKRIINKAGHKATSDSRWLLKSGIPTAFGLAAEGKNLHGPNESVNIEHFLESIKMQASLIINTVG